MWIIAGPILGFSDTWQLLINSLASVVTFLMVFLIQNTQNRDTMALQIKLDELIRVQEGTHNALLDLEELTEEQLTEVSEKYRRIAQAARENIEAGRQDTGSEDV
jgi:low affinity Fe/Cu permease